MCYKFIIAWFSDNKGPNLCIKRQNKNLPSKSDIVPGASFSVVVVVVVVVDAEA
jgi:hypothetical protein